MVEETSQHGEIMHQLGILEGKVDAIANLQTIANGRTSKLELRVDSLEKSRDIQSGFKMTWREILGFITGIGGVIIAIISVAVMYLHK